MESVVTYRTEGELSGDEYRSGLLIINLNDSPPHIGLVHEGLLWHLTTEGGRSDDFKGFLRQSRRLGTASLFVPMAIQLSTMDVINAFEKYEQAAGNVSCLVPIGESLVKWVRHEPEAVVFELIQALEDKDLLEPMLGVNLVENMAKIRGYTFEDVKRNLIDKNRMEDAVGV